TPTSPLHDGAVIIRGDQIVAAGCILPLSQNPRISPALGTRHRAAIGISEETDAVAVCVSEYSQAISIAYRGAVHERLDEGELRSELSRIFRIRDAGDEAESSRPSPAAPAPPPPTPLAAAGGSSRAGSTDEP